MDEFRRLVEELLPFGEDEKELRFWEAIFEDLAPDQQKDVIENLKTELEALKKLRDQQEDERKKRGSQK